MRPLAALLLAGLIMQASTALAVWAPRAQRIVETVAVAGAPALGGADKCEPLTQVQLQRT